MEEATSTHPYQGLTPDLILCALESQGFECDGRLLALNSYENRVYQIGLESSTPVVAKFYRPRRWSDEQILDAARVVAEHGGSILRAGTFLAGSSPYQYRGLGADALWMLEHAGRETRLPVSTEVLEPDHVDVVAEHVDVIEVGPDNMQNFVLLRAVGATSRPIIIHRAPFGSMERFVGVLIEHFAGAFPLWLAPEQVRGEPVDHRADIFALGCVIYEMLSGAPPFGGATVQALLAKRLTGPPPHLTNVPSPVDEVIRRSLATAPQDRFATAGGLGVGHGPTSATLTGAPSLR